MTEVVDAIAVLRSTQAVRARAQALLARARAGQSVHFTLNDAALAPVAVRVAHTTHSRYPDLNIPYHSRWRHFEAGAGLGKVDRLGQLAEKLGKVSLAKQARAQIDLAIVSVLLDAGSGPDWRYQDARSAHTYTRSEGLGVASFNAFTSGLFSSKPTQPAQADAQGLRAITKEQLGEAFQVSRKNPLVGLEGRAALLRKLGEVIEAQPAVFGGAGGQCRPGRLFDHLLQNDATQVDAHAILVALLNTLSSIWPAQNQLVIGESAHSTTVHPEPVEGPVLSQVEGLRQAQPERGGDQPGRAQTHDLGDCWRHSAVQGDGPNDSATRGWMPFHKLSQWLTYSLLEPFEWAGVRVTGLDQLTGLPEYRNGGLLLDGGVIVPRHPAALQNRYQAGDEFIVEWRALTVALLDELAPLVRQLLGKTEAQMPLACVLEGGTWATGRVLAQELRHGAPPLNIQSDGTVF